MSYKMTKEEVFRAIDFLRDEVYAEDLLIRDRLLNYLEANVDEFIECYEEVE